MYDLLTIPAEISGRMVEAVDAVATEMRRVDVIRRANHCELGPADAQHERRHWDAVLDGIT